MGSKVSIPKPFMGFDKRTSSSTEDRYNETRLGTCWELYGIKEKENYPPYMSYTISTTSAENYTGSYWSDWKNVETPNCSFAPTSSLKSMVSADGKQENVSWNIYYQYD